MTKQELMENCTVEQIADMVSKLQSASEVKNDEIHKLKWQTSNLEEENGRLQAKLDTYNDYLLPRATKEAKELIDHNHFSGVRIVTCEQWNNRNKSEGKSGFPKSYEQTVKEILNTDTSQIQDDCHRFGIEGLQKYLKNPAPIKIPKRDNKSMSISEIQKCQEEYEKLLKESPMERTINKISEDILKQKNNAMAMEFTRIICDLLKRYGVYVRCAETKFSEKITINSIEEKYGIKFDGMDFSQHDKEFTEEIEKLQKELKQRQNAIDQIDRIICELFGIAHNGYEYTENFKELLKEKSAVGKTISDFLPTEPIAVAEMLITASGNCEPLVLGNETYKDTYKIFDISDLRQIAEHLLVYCNHNGEVEE